MGRAPQTTPLPDVSELSRLFEYDAQTGVLSWRARADSSADWNTRYAGKRAGRADELGRIRITIGGSRVRAHRIVFKMVHGFEPSIIDHINGNPGDNRIENLRPCDYQQNQQNKKGTSKAGLPKGVSIRPAGGFGASIKFNGKSIWLGTFETCAEAAAAYQGAAIALFGDFAKFNRGIQ